MVFKLIAVILLLATCGSSEETQFTYNGFQSVGLALDGAGNITNTGLLQLTNYTSQNQMGHAFYPNAITFKNSSTNGTAYSFSTTFVFAMVPQNSTSKVGSGMTFVVAPHTVFPGALPAEYFGLFNSSNVGNESNHVFAVELDTIPNTQFHDPTSDHLGIDINGLDSIEAKPAGYYPNASNPGNFENLTLGGTGKKMQVWVEYDGTVKLINVTLAPFGVERPLIPLISLPYDLSPIMKETMYVDFSAGTLTLLTSYYVLGWSFKMNGKAQELNLSNLPELIPPPANLPEVPPPTNLPAIPPHPTGQNNGISQIVIGVGVGVVSSLCFILFGIWGTIYYVRRKKKFADVLEDWELEYGARRFKYKDLYVATKEFRKEYLLGAGGFGKVYRGVLPSSNTEVAVKRFSHETEQGMQEFVAEVISIGRLSHRNLVSLHGYCRRKGEMLLVSDYMCNGSLDKYLYNHPKHTALNWSQRFKILKGVGSGLLYLHEGWEKVVIHRDIKASNVLLDQQFNGKLGDFGLARLCDHGSTPQTTNLMGTLGYLAPEFMRTGRASKATDVFAFGAFLLEVVSGKRPFAIPGSEEDDMMLVDWVLLCWSKGNVVEALDPNLQNDYAAGEVEMVLMLGLLCSHSDPRARPTMHQVVQYLEREATLPQLSSLAGGTSSPNDLASAIRNTVDDLALAYAAAMDKQVFWSSCPIPTDQLHLSRGR